MEKIKLVNSYKNFNYNFKSNNISSEQNNNTETEKKDYKKISAIAGIAITSIAIATMLLKKKTVQPVKTPNTINKTDVSIPNEKINPLEFFKKNILSIFEEEKDNIDLDKISQPVILQNGTKTYTLTFTDKNKKTHSLKAAFDKDDNFIHLFDRITENSDERSTYSALKKYNKIGIMTSAVYKSEGETVGFKAYSTTGINGYYVKTMHYDNNEVTNIRITKGLDEIPQKEINMATDIRGNKITVTTDYTKAQPVHTVKSDKKLGNEVIIIDEFTPDEQNKVNATLFKLDNEGNVVEKTTKKIDAIWAEEANEIDITKNITKENWEGLYAYKLNSYKKADKDLLEFLEKNQNLTIENDFDSLFTNVEKTDFDVPEKFAIAVQNTAQQKGNAYICDEVPEMFKGIEQKELCEYIDNLMIHHQKTKGAIEFEIAGKKFRSKAIGGGVIGAAYKIEDTLGNSVIIKRYSDPNLMGRAQGLYTEIPIARQLTMDKVNDVPKFYMANPLGQYISTADCQGITQGGWMMCEYIEKDTPVKKGCISLNEWLKEKRLAHYDVNSGTCIGNYTVDLGGIGRFENGKQQAPDLGRVLASYNKYGTTASDIIKAVNS